MDEPTTTSDFAELREVSKKIQKEVQLKHRRPSPSASLSTSFLRPLNTLTPSSLPLSAPSGSLTDTASPSYSLVCLPQIPGACVLSTFFSGPSDAPDVVEKGKKKIPTNFESMLDVPGILRGSTMIYCVSEWALGTSPEAAQHMFDAIQMGTEADNAAMWTYVCMVRPPHHLVSLFSIFSCALQQASTISLKSYVVAVRQTKLPPSEVLYVSPLFPLPWQGPGNPQPNWHLNMNGGQHRAVAWRSFMENASGMLYWGVNCCENNATNPKEPIVFREVCPPPFPSLPHSLCLE